MAALRALSTEPGGWRARRWRAAASAFLVLLALSAGGVARANRAVAPAQIGDDLRAFGESLVALRSGDAGAANALSERAARLCEHWGRCDAVEVARFYLELSPDERSAGWRAELELRALRDAVYEAGVTGLRGVEWETEAARLRAELESLAERAQSQPDFTPAAGARSLIAVLEAQALEAGSREKLDVERRKRAREQAQSSLELYARAGQRTPQLEPLWALARLELASGERDGARAHFAECERLARSVGRDDYRELSLQGFVTLARLEGDVHAQEAALLELASFRSPAQSWPMARDWGARLLSDDYAAEAAEFLERYAPRQDSHAVDREEWDLLIGSARLRAGDSDGAREHFERVASSAGGELAVLALASLALHEQREFEALELLSSPERLSSFSPLGRARAQSLLGEAYARTDQLELARESLEQACAAAATWERERGAQFELQSPLARAAGSVVGERLGLHTIALLADVLARQGAGLEAVRLCEEWQSRSLRAGAELSSASLREWAAAFELGLLTWVVGADFTFVAHLAPDGQVSHARVRRGRRSLEDAVRRLRELTLAPDSAAAGAAPSRWSRQARAFLDEIVPPAVSSAMARLSASAGGAPRLLLSLHGPLEAAPLEALPWEQLVGAEDLALVTSIGLPGAGVGPRPAAESLEQWNLLGGPVDAGGREALPGARDELAAALAVRPRSTLVLGGAFDRETLLAALSSRSPLHLATHLNGVVEAESERASAAATSTAFSVSGGANVSVEDVARLQPRLPLAVLSACWTGGGRFVDAEGLLGMARAFVGAGTRNVVVTLWPVDDAAAAEFGAAFHRALHEQGESPSAARACAAARRRLRELGFERSGWAAFRLVGRD